MRSRMLIVSTLLALCGCRGDFWTPIYDSVVDSYAIDEMGHEQSPPEFIIRGWETFVCTHEGSGTSMVVVQYDCDMDGAYFYSRPDQERATADKLLYGYPYEYVGVESTGPITVAGYIWDYSNYCGEWPTDHYDSNDDDFTDGHNSFAFLEFIRDDTGTIEDIYVSPVPWVEERIHIEIIEEGHSSEACKIAFSDWSGI